MLVDSSLVLVSVTAVCGFPTTAAGKRFSVFRVDLVNSSGLFVDASDLSVSSASIFDYQNITKFTVSAKSNRNNLLFDKRKC